MYFTSHAVVRDLLDGLETVNWDHLPDKTQVYTLCLICQSIVNGALAVCLPGLLEDLSSVDLLEVRSLLRLTVE